MAKTTPEIAKALLERRNRMTHVILPGEIHAAIGPDGVSEALSKRWLVPDLDEGFLCVTTDFDKLAEMRKLADMKPEEYKQEPIPVAESHDVALAHTRREHRLNEIAAPMTGGASPSLSTLGQATQAPQAPQAPQGAGKDLPFGIGTPVMVARQGQSASGVIEKLNPDGRFQVGFPAGQQRPQGDNIYSKEELQAVPAAAAAAQRPAMA